MNADIIEIFLSIQGEGLYTGTKQLFIRFAGCNLNCSYCDTQFNKRDNCKIYYNQYDSKQYEVISNPITEKMLIDIINKFEVYNYSYLSLTGGEPLLHSTFLKNFLPNIKKDIMLETNGILYNELNTIINYIDIVSMDFKFNSVTGCNINYGCYKNFIKIAGQKELYIKLVVNDKLTSDDIENFLELNVSNNSILIIQPVTDKNRVKKSNVTKAEKFQTQLLKYFDDVRVIPQIHPLLNVL